MIKIYFLLAFALLASICGYCQNLSVENFIEKYHRHVDPDSKLDTIKYFMVDYTMFIESSRLPNQTVQMNRTCYHSIDKEPQEVCIDPQVRHKMKFEIFDMENQVSAENLIKYNLNYIPLDSLEQFSMIMQNDSITVIKKALKKDDHFFTFDTKTLNLLQIKRVTTSGNHENGVSYTNFMKYDIIDGITVPTKVEYEGKLATATVLYSNHSFAPFDRSVFDR